jgi:hypothetical protein
MSKDKIDDACPFPPGLDPSKTQVMNISIPKFRIDKRIIYLAAVSVFIIAFYMHYYAENDFVGYKWQIGETKFGIKLLKVDGYQIDIAINSHTISNFYTPSAGSTGLIGVYDTESYRIYFLYYNEDMGFVRYKIVPLNSIIQQQTGGTS